MADHNDLGRRGEDAACLFLSEKHYTLLARNWTSGHNELDIVADYFGELVIVEVKTRSYESMVPAKAAVDLEKRERIVAAARDYVAYHRLDCAVRYDIITVIGQRPPFKIEHIINAFSPTTNYLDRRHL